MAIPGIYREPVREELQVHVLEHGHVPVQYARDVSPADVGPWNAWAASTPATWWSPPTRRSATASGWLAAAATGRTLDARSVDGFITTKVAGRYDHSWQDGATDCLTG